MRSIWPQLVRINLFDSVQELKVPVFFINGQHDHNTPMELLDKYFKVLNAPYKKIYTFEKSAHLALYEEAGLFNRIMIEEVLKMTNESENENKI